MIEPKFNQYAAEYDSTTPIQDEVARYLWQKIAQFQSLSPNQALIWLDVGCGTGKLSQELLKAYTTPATNVQLIALDKSPAMLGQFSQRLFEQNRSLAVSQVITVISADMTAMPLDTQSVDRIISSFALHWVSSNVLNELTRVVRVGGQVHLAIPVKGSLNAVQQRCPKLPIFPFIPASDWIECIEKILHSHHGRWLYNEQLCFYHVYPNLTSLLKSLKHMGGAVSGQSPMPSGILKQYLADTQPIALDYQVLVVGFEC